MSVIIIIGVAVVLLATICGFAIWWDSKRETRDARPRGAKLQRRGPSIGALSFKSRRRAVAATLQVATAHLPPPARGATLRYSRQGTFLDRVVRPVASRIARLAGRVSPPGYVDSVRRRLKVAGRDSQADSDVFLAGRVATIALIPVGFFLVELLSVSRFYRLLAFLLVTITLVLGPEASLNRRAEARQEKIRRQLPSLVDLLMISVEAGLGFDQALTRAVGSLPGPLSEEFGRFLGEVRMGGDRAESLEGIDDRTDVPELRSFLMALIQEERFGVSIGSILRAQAGDIRVSQRQHIQELAQKAPVKMLFPLVICVLPALFIVVIGPAGIEIYNTIIKGHGL
ncbi:MAG TPA: type II secretion system F family protein [Acidimicrobiales bacterium]|nr:type II secretion system F family protein [Acidimicrobiales bacterium]